MTGVSLMQKRFDDIKVISIELAHIFICFYLISNNFCVGENLTSNLTYSSCNILSVV